MLPSCYNNTNNEVGDTILLSMYVEKNIKEHGTVYFLFTYKHRIRKYKYFWLLLNCTLRKPYNE